MVPLISQMWNVECTQPLLSTFMIEAANLNGFDFKGSVQRKLRWVRNSTIRWLLIWDHGDGHFVVI
jgi:hypothetical protein